MAYRNYRGTSSRSSRPSTPGPVDRPNRKAGDCRGCGDTVPAMAGLLYVEADGSWSVRHAPASWTGSPVSGFYIGGCLAATDELNAAGNFPAPRSESDRLADVAATASAMAPARPSRSGSGKYAYTSSGARMTMSSRRCEDAPCCGCCG